MTERERELLILLAYKSGEIVYAEEAVRALGLASKAALFARLKEQAEEGREVARQVMAGTGAVA